MSLARAPERLCTCPGNNGAVLTKGVAPSPPDAIGCFALEGTSVPASVRGGGISLVIPAYNEADRLGPTLDAYLPALEALHEEFEVIVIMDGTDATPAVVERYRERHVVGYRYDHKLGRGGAIFEGFRKARNHVVGYADADGSVGAKDLVRLLQWTLDGEKVVIASRRLHPRVVLVPEPSLKRMASFLWHVLVRALMHLQVRDAQCGLKLFSKEMVQDVLREVVVTNRTFEVAMLYHLRRKGVSIREVPVAYVHDFRTRMPIGKAIPVMFLTLLGVVAVNGPLRSVLPVRFMEALNRRFGNQ